VSQSDFVSRGQALVAAGQFQEAVKVCRLGLLGRPTTVEGRVVLGQALLALKRFDEVLAEMRVALELDQSSVPAQVLRAEALLKKGDTHPAIEALHKARQQAPGDPRILQLLGEAEHGASRQSVSHPAVNFVGTGDTKNYPGHTSGAGGDYDEGRSTEHFTRPTSVSSPGGTRRSSKRDAVPDPDAIPDPVARRSSKREAVVEPDPMPTDDELSVGDRSGTVEVDPELEGVEVAGDPDFDDVLAAPPSGAAPAAIGGSRGSVKSLGKAPKAVGATASSKPSLSRPTPTASLDLDDDDVEELAETHSPDEPPRRPSRSQVRAAVAMPSGVIGELGSSQNRPKPGKSVPPPRSEEPRAKAPSNSPFGGGFDGRAKPPSQSPFGGGSPFENRSKPPSAAPPPAVPLPPAPRINNAALPTMAAAPQPPPPFVQQSPFALPQNSAFAKPQHQPSSPVANMPTMALPPQPPPPESPVWARATMAAVADPRSVAASQEPTARPDALDPALLALMAEQPQQAPPQQKQKQKARKQEQPPSPARTGMRRSRSKLQIALWLVLAVGVIGGGVFAGFQIRAIRLKKQIAAARQRATDLAKADTFSGWSAARDSLASIVDAQPTLDNRAALARTRALIAYEFGDGLAEAKAAVDDVTGKGGFDAQLATAYYALAQHDVKAAKAAVDASSSDPASLFASAQVALMQGDPKAAVTALKTAADKDPRPLYGIALARAHAANYNWDEAIAALDRVLAGNTDHPEAVIARGNILAASGRIGPGVPLGNEMRSQLERIIYEARRPLGEQQHGVSPTELAFAFLALAQVDFARGDVNAARRDLRAAADINLDDQRFAEEVVDTLLMFGDYNLARSQLDALMKAWPTSRAAKIALAQIEIAQGRATDAEELLTKATDALALPEGMTTRGEARLAQGDLVGAASDFDAVLKKVPMHEPAVIGRAWVDIANGDIDAATKRVAERFNAKGSSPALTTAYAATLRRSADPAARDKAKELLEKVVTGPAGPDVARAQLELARIYRDTGMYLEARTAYIEASKTGSFEARLEHALLLIEDREPVAGRTIIESLLKEAGQQPSGQLVIEGARARMLTGDHVGATQLLDLADKMSSVERWKVDRERGRLALRRSKFDEAASALGRALDGCGSDAETFLLAADTATAKPELAKKLEQLASARLKGRPEQQIIEGKLLVAQGKDAEAEAAFKRAQEALRNEKASRRRLAQADFGLAVIASNRGNSVEAKNKLELVMGEDPTIVDAYIFAAVLSQDRPKEAKKAFELATKAVELNPDYAFAWLTVGKLAKKMGDKKSLIDAINRLTAIAPAGDELKELQALR
jgi:tetratricopeptide (TPR) repeat protein